MQLIPVRALPLYCMPAALLYSLSFRSGRAVSVCLDTYHSMTHYSSTAAADLLSTEGLSQVDPSHDFQHRWYALAFDVLSAF
jgi:hypothetical protein